MAYLGKFLRNRKKELQAILRSNDLQRRLSLVQTRKQMEECRDFIALSDKANHPIVLFDMLERYGKRPYGWPDDEVLILVASLLVLGEIQLMMNGAPITIDKVFENIHCPTQATQYYCRQTQDGGQTNHRRSAAILAKMSSPKWTRQ